MRRILLKCTLIIMLVLLCNAFMSSILLVQVSAHLLQVPAYFQVNHFLYVLRSFFSVIFLLRTQKILSWNLRTKVNNSSWKPVVGRFTNERTQRSSTSYQIITQYRFLSAPIGISIQNTMITKESSVANFVRIIVTLSPSLSPRCLLH